MANVVLPGTGALIAVDVRSTENYQKVAVVPRGTTPFDTGLVALPTTTASLSSATLYINSFYFFNASDQYWKVTLQNQASTLKWLEDYPLPPRGILFVPFGGPGATIVGLRWHAENSLVYGQVLGWS